MGGNRTRNWGQTSFSPWFCLGLIYVLFFEEIGRKDIVVLLVCVNCMANAYSRLEVLMVTNI